MKNQRGQKLKGTVKPICFCHFGDRYQVDQVNFQFKPKIVEKDEDNSSETTEIESDSEFIDTDSSEQSKEQSSEQSSEQSTRKYKDKLVDDFLNNNLNFNYHYLKMNKCINNVNYYTF